MSLSSAALSAGRATLRLWRSAAWRQGATFGSRRLQQAPLVAQAQQQAGRPQQQGGPGRRAASSAALPEPVAAAAAAAAPPVAAEQHTHLQPPPARQQQQQQQDSAAHGAIEIVVGPMFAGKSTELLRRVARYEAEGLCVAVVKSDKDDRYCAAHVVTHSGIKRPCFAVPTLAAFKAAAGAAYAGFQVIAVDEAQFFPDLREFCAHAADHEHKRLILAGLDGDFQRQRFGQVLDLLPLADSVTKLSARCKFCAQEQRRTAAVFSLRIAADSRQELVGGADVYAPVCRRHYVQLTSVRQHGGAESDGGAGGAA
ncbi:Thymidine kinase [Micractinium conductrix]|uniref:thymidine kinase n=1 Tax=Micractinium conductrix TaxID=554055 RepID=A0A2P6VCP1_9CHLO|nr:Thymidine kinase [Micractinium conductrix]|eukprot:PSC71863.1 Thymidine kinase [Micractinium conductrix]